MREWDQHRQEVFVPLAHPPGHAQADFGEAMVVIAGVEQKSASSCSTCRIVMPAMSGLSGCGVGSAARLLLGTEEFEKPAQSAQVPVATSRASNSRSARQQAI